jgi:hypothetical protein
MGINGRRLNVTHSTDTNGRFNSSLVGINVVIVVGIGIGAVEVLFTF